MSAPILITPTWSVPASVRAVSTTRLGGHSLGTFAGLNLGIRAGDDVQTVTRNREQLTVAADLPRAPRWLKQVHGTRVVNAGLSGDDPEADAAYSTACGEVCVVMSADCLPVLFAARDGSCVAAAHAGWRGLSRGVLESVMASLPVEPSGLCAWMGPCIGPTAFEVGDDVHGVFCTHDAEAARHFKPGRLPGKWMADLQGLARVRLEHAGVHKITADTRCTYRDATHFYSYRRDGAESGRMASLIWLAD